MTDAAPMRVIRKFEPLAAAQVPRDEAAVKVDSLVTEVARLFQEGLSHQIEIGPTAGLGGVRITKAVNGEYNGSRGQSGHDRQIPEEGVDHGEGRVHTRWVRRCVGIAGIASG